MTVYITELLAQIEARFGKLSAGELTAKLLELGIVDHTLCKVLAVRQEVARLTAGGMRRTDAMWHATEKFCCSYEYVRKCMYYYRDINLDQQASASEN
ncbi:MAG: hypothetical protein LIO77_08830 [Rikenellaceae bacterium]|nr:hypothetical protein [Rikenellaceae bacterium]